jgi:GntR family transcriptional regulator/MocR family aminotransferase
MALAGYLASSRSVNCTSQRIIITSGAQQALTIALLATLKKNESILVEHPGYTQMCKITDLFHFDRQIAPVYERTGLDINTVLKSNAKALYVTPSNQYPLGTTLNIEQRLQLIEWAQEHQTWLIEDDYDSEFQFAHQPYPCMQGLANQMGFEDRILYVGSFSKVMFNGLRIGYLVVPDSLINQCLTIKEALSGDTPTHSQAALADFIREGYLLRHIRKMRRLYKSKYLDVVAAINQEFGDDVAVVSQAAGMHVTLKWTGGISENQWQHLAAKSGIILRPLNYYEQPHDSQIHSRQWRGAVLGFGNIALAHIAEKIALLATLFYQPS